MDLQGFGVGSRAGSGAQTTFPCSKTEPKNPTNELMKCWNTQVLIEELLQDSILFSVP